MGISKQWLRSHAVLVAFDTSLCDRLLSNPYHQIREIKLDSRHS